MKRSSFACLFVILAAAIAAGCWSGSSNQKPKPPPVPVQTATLDVTAGLRVLGRFAMPQGFTPLPGRPPLWMQEGKEVVVMGVRNGHTTILGYSGAGWSESWVLAEDGGSGAKGGVIVDVAGSPDGMALALAVQTETPRRVSVIVRDLIASGEGHPVASFDGDLEVTSLAWLDPFTIALALTPTTSGSSPGAPEMSPAPATSQDSSARAASAAGLYIISINGMLTADLLRLSCPLSHLVWGPAGHYAVGEGDPKTSPVLIDRQALTCRTLGAIGPVRVLDWSHAGNSFLYAQAAPSKPTSVFRYQIGTKSAQLIAICSEAAAFTHAGDVLALGNQQLNIRWAALNPNAKVRAELALLKRGSSSVDIQSLGFDTTLALLSHSTMVYSRAAHSAAIDTVSITPLGPLRRIIAYSLIDGDALVVASGAPGGLVLVSWSQAGRYLAILDGKPGNSALTIIAIPL